MPHAALALLLVSITGRATGSSVACRCARPNRCFDEVPWAELGPVVADVVQVDTRQPAARDPLWLGDQPGAFQQTGAQGSPDVPGWASVNATASKVATLRSTDDASRAVRFAAQHGLAVAIKNTGHDWFGRSSYKGGGHFLLWTHQLTETRWLDSFVPDGCAEDAGSVVTVGAGVQFWQLYDEALERQRMVVGGTCPVVGMLGFALMGGYGDYSRMYGSGATNMVQAEVVLASGEVVTASSCNAQADLFRALRGGGGSFGLVTKATFRTYASPVHGTFGSIQGAFSDNLEGRLEQLLVWYHGIVQAGLAKHFGGTIRIAPTSFTVLLSYVGLDVQSCNGLLRHSNESLQLACQPSPRLWKPDHTEISRFGAKGWYTDWSAQYASAYFFETSTRYIRPENIAPAAAGRLAALLLQLARDMQPFDASTVFTISLNYALGGGSEAATRWMNQTTVHPQVATALGAVKLTRDRSAYTPSGREALDQARWAHLQRYHAALDTAMPGAGAYANEGDYGEEAWQERYWGSAYPELLRTKRKYDPSALFTCHQCVGAEAAPPRCQVGEGEVTTWI